MARLLVEPQTHPPQLNIWHCELTSLHHQGNSTNLRDYGYKAHADAVAGLAKSLGVERIILGGHDWGGMVVYRIAQYYPDLISHVFSVCTSYMPTRDTWVPLEQLVQKLPAFGYQLQFGSDDHKVEQVVKDAATMRKFLSGMYGAKTSSGRPIMIPERGVDLDVIKNDDVGLSPLMDQEVRLTMPLEVQSEH
jgi:pimeloyl-ACP methyl ester carboxylesterase